MGLFAYNYILYCSDQGVQVNFLIQSLIDLFDNQWKICDTLWVIVNREPLFWGAHNKQSKWGREKGGSKIQRIIVDQFQYIIIHNIIVGEENLPHYQLW